MKLKPLHKWPRTCGHAIRLQNRFRGRVIMRPIRGPVRVVAGADVSYDEPRGLVHAGVVLMRLPRFEVLEQCITSVPGSFPYVPGLLSFREAPALIEAFRRLERRPDAVIFDAQGVAHMRHIGLASHVGLWLGVPSVGCAKSRLVGEHRDVPLVRGRRAPLRYDGRIVGSVVCTRDGVRPVYVSPGHLADIPTSVRLVLRCARRFRLPEPVRAAHALVTRAREAARTSSL